jgi:hypothetical protein
MTKKNVLRITCVLLFMLSGLAFLLLPGHAAAQVGGNLVLNPDFETAGTGGAADAANWSEGLNHARASDKFHSGGWSLKSTYTGTGTSTRTSAPIAVLANHSYTFSGWIWRDSTTGGSCMDMNDVAGEAQLCTTVTGSWQFKSGVWNSGSNTSVTLRLITDGSPNGNVWFDDISLVDNASTTGTPTATVTNASTNTPTNTPAGPSTNTPTRTPTNTATSAPSSNLVLNPSFETAGAGGAADAANWTEAASHTRTSDKFHTGGWSLKSTYTGTGVSTDTTVPIAVTANTAYTYSGWIWRDSTTGGSCMDMNDVAGEAQLCTTATGSWIFLSGVWNSGSNTSVTLRLITDGTPNNSIWFDDISLVAQVNPPTPTATLSANTVIVAGAGDIACGVDSASANCKQTETSNLLLSMNPDKVIVLGDNQYENGALSDFQSFFDPSWGRLKAKISPSVGNHEYLTSGASGYFTYFGSAAGDPAKGYYSYNLGAWHLVVLNTECGHAGGCALGSQQYNWLQSDLTANPGCTLVYTHHPRWTSDTRAFDDTEMQDMIQLMYDKGVELLIVGHSHLYERFRRNDPNQNADPNYGLRQIIVGTGGRNVYGFGTIEPGSEVRNGTTFGVIKFTLRPTDYTWDFVPIAGQTFTDTGTETCHGPHP